MSAAVIEFPNAPVRAIVIRKNNPHSAVLTTLREQSKVIHAEMLNAYDTYQALSDMLDQTIAMIEALEGNGDFAA